MCTIIDCILYMYSVQHLAELLALPSAVPDAINDAMDAPIHTYIRKQYPGEAVLESLGPTHCSSSTPSWSCRRNAAAW